MILSRNMLKTMGESRHPCRTPIVVRNQSPMLLLKKTVALLVRFLMTWIRLVLMLYFFMVAHKSCMPNPVEGLLEVYEIMVEVLLELEIFLTENA